MKQVFVADLTVKPWQGGEPPKPGAILRDTATGEILEVIAIDQTGTHLTVVRAADSK